MLPPYAHLASPEGSSASFEAHPRAIALIPWDASVDFHRPSIDATGQTHRSLNPLTTQPDHRIETPHAVVTIDHQLLAVGQSFDAAQVRRDRIHRNQLARFDAGCGVFIVFAAVEENDFGLVGNEFRELGRGDFDG